MAKKKVSFAQMADVIGSGRAALRGRDERVVLHVVVDADAPRDLAVTLRDALVAERLGGVVEVCAVGGPLPSGDAPDAAMVLVGSCDACAVVSSYARSGIPVAMIVEGALDAPELDLPEQAAALVGVIAAASPDALLQKLAEWLVGATDKGIALGANFPFCRRAVADSLIARCAVENAAVGAISLIPGSDFPIMTANQAKLALDIAAAYGCGVEPSRAIELAAVVGGGLTWRALARTVVGMVPGIGALLKAGVAFGGTMATGNAIRLRFESGFAGGASDLSDGSRDEAPRRNGLSAGPRDDGYVTIEGGRS